MNKKEHKRERRRVVAGCGGWSWVQINKHSSKGASNIWYVIDPSSGDELDVGSSPVPLTRWGKRAVAEFSKRCTPVTDR